MYVVHSDCNGLRGWRIPRFLCRTVVASECAVLHAVDVSLEGARLVRELNSGCWINQREGQFQKSLFHAAYLCNGTREFAGGKQDSAHFPNEFFRSFPMIPDNAYYGNCT